MDRDATTLDIDVYGTANTDEVNVSAHVPSATITPDEARSLAEKFERVANHADPDHESDTPTNDPDDYPHSPGILVVPTEEDIPVLRRLLTDAYDNIRADYEARQESPRYTEEVEREGSLIQELQAQLRAVKNE